MAATKYNIFIKYINGTRVVTKQTDIQWMSYYESYELSVFDKENGKEYESIIKRIADGEIKLENLSVKELEIYTKCKKYRDYEEAVDKGLAVRENAHIEPFDEMYVDPQVQNVYPTFERSKRIRAMKDAKTKRDTELQKLMVDEAKPTNPKLNMIFMYEGVGRCEAALNVYNPNQMNQDPQIIPYALYDNMKRVNYNPWFFYAQYASLKAAMNKAAELVNILGTEGVLIGKCVELDQYIDIV